MKKRKDLGWNTDENGVWYYKYSIEQVKWLQDMIGAGNSVGVTLYQAVKEKVLEKDIWAILGYWVDEVVDMKNGCDKTKEFKDGNKKKDKHG